ncbi:MAG: hypothetical protein GAK30_03758 [Paracidovorax wautersii]|uniref:Uncharacterized protein n=1 Tax=Paracidovorax wautersii TaxID=1177982 RepID=A0A7V8JNK9_9BURK|nr:MAG: hypothetical protein GAK30_03758 [Paracidovorax wautersii]
MTNFQRIAVGLVAAVSLVSVLFVVTNHSNERQALYTKTHPAATAEETKK